MRRGTGAKRSIDLRSSDGAADSACGGTTSSVFTLMCSFLGLQFVEISMITSFRLSSFIQYDTTAVATDPSLAFFNVSHFFQWACLRIARVLLLARQ